MQQAGAKLPAAMLGRDAQILDRAQSGVVANALDRAAILADCRRRACCAPAARWRPAKNPACRGSRASADGSRPNRPDRERRWRRFPSESCGTWPRRALRAASRPRRSADSRPGSSAGGSVRPVRSISIRNRLKYVKPIDATGRLEEAPARSTKWRQINFSGRAERCQLFGKATCDITSAR